MSCLGFVGIKRLVSAISLAVMTLLVFIKIPVFLFVYSKKVKIKKERKKKRVILNPWSLGGSFLVQKSLYLSLSPSFKG